MKYLFTSDASKKQGGYQFTPVTRVAGQLFGTLAVESGAEQILAAGGKWVQEISKGDFDAYELRRADFSKEKSVFKMADEGRNTLVKAAPKVSASVADILKPKPVK
jgi:hypothetical protein